ncbi:YkgJ family cysteine cluster protein [Candidatus Sumerlaeota bacterium]
MASRKIDKFVCRRCGNCCAIEGYVTVDPDEAVRIAAQLGISVAELRRDYMTPLGDAGSWSFIDHPGTTDCIMLTEDRLCRIQQAKPRQCVDFPGSWRTHDAQKYCQGLKRDDR